MNIDKTFKSVLFLAAILIFFLSQQIYSQDFRFEQITSADGLANNSVSGIIQDKRGFLWFSTHDGLNRYDGKNFRLFEFEPFNPDSLRNNFIKIIFYDNDKDFIWLGTKHGLCILDPVTEKTVDISIKNQEVQGILDSEITAIEKDKEGNFWVGTNNGLVKINNKTDDFFIFNSSREKSFFIPDNSIKDIFCDPKNNLWISDQNGEISFYKDGVFVNYFNCQNSDKKQDKKEQDKKDQDKNKLFSIAKISTDILLIGSWGEGIVLFDTNTKKYSTHKIGNNKISKIKYDTNGRIWVGTWGDGLYYFNNAESIKKNIYTRIVHDRNIEYTLSSNIIYSIFEDNSGRLWVGTDGYGVNKRSQMQRNYKTQYYIEETSIENGISSLLVDNKDNLWVGSTKNGLYFFNNENKTKAHYKHNPGDLNSITGSAINSVFIDTAENIWVLTDSGLNKFIKKNNNFEHFYFDGEKITNSAKNIDIGKNKFYSCKEDRDGKLWFGTSNGVYIWDRENGITRHISKDSPNGKRLSDNSVNAIDIDKEGIVWIGTEYGLNKYDPTTEKIEIYYHAFNIDSLSSNSIKTIYCDLSSNVWIGTNGGGVSVYNREKNNFNSFTKKEGLGNNTIIGLTEDHKGNIIVITLQGVSMIIKKINKELSTVTSLTDHFGLSGITFCGSISKDRNANIYLSSTDGEIYKINTVLYYLNRENPEIVITDLLIGEKSYLKLFGKNIFAEKEINLKWNDGHISLDFRAIDYSFAKGIEYKYILEGFDKYWIFSKERNYASYTAIPPGKYKFRVTGTNSSGVWSTKEASLKINIIPPFYKTPIAYLVYILALIALFYVILAAVRGREMRNRLHEVSKLKDELLEVNLELEKQTRIDSLTGVHNRKHFNEIFEKFWNLYLRTKMDFSILMLDIDHFKNFNDTYGHVAGDKTIKTVAEMIVEGANRKTDSVFRYGGEEFAVLLINTNLEGARVVAEKIRKKVMEKKIENGKDGNGIRYVTVSIGVTSSNAVKTESSTQLLAVADDNLYKAKSFGRNRVV